jgi:ribonuclease HII
LRQKQTKETEQPNNRITEQPNNRITGSDPALPKPSARHIIPYMPQRLYAGMDEAGRGCVIGPLVVAIVAAEDRDRRWFAKHNVRDSKLVQAKKRDELAEGIRERCWHKILVAEPWEVDDALYDPGRSLNELEMEIMITLLRHFQETFPKRDTRIMVDAISPSEEAIRKRLQTGSRNIVEHLIDARHRADRRDRTVGAASILAKAERERLIRGIKEDLGRDFGSGYCHDERTRAFLRACPNDCPHVRWSWSTARERR